MFNFKKMWGPEDIAYKVYSFFTLFRKQMFYVLVISIFISIFCTAHFQLIGADFFFLKLNKMVEFLIAIGAITAAYVAISIEIIRKQMKSKDVTRIWGNLAKNIIYPFAVALFIEVILFFEKTYFFVIRNESFFLIFIFSLFLTINSVFTLLDAIEGLINEEWRTKLDTGQKNQRI